MDGLNTNNSNTNTNTSVNNNTTVVYDNISAINVEIDGVNPPLASKSLYPTIGVAFGMLALLCMIVALVANDISGHKLVIDITYASYTYETTCKWNEYRLFGEYTSTSSSSSGYTFDYGYYYKHYCEKEEESAPDDHYFCQAYKSGAVFVAFGIASIVISGCAILAANSPKFQARVRIQSFVSWMFLACAVFVLIALIVWSNVNTNDKSDDTLINIWYFRSCFDVGDEDYYIGPSYILYVIGGIFYLLAFLMTFLHRNIPFKTCL